MISGDGKLYGFQAPQKLEEISTYNPSSVSFPYLLAGSLALLGWMLDSRPRSWQQWCKVLRGMVLASKQLGKPS